MIKNDRPQTVEVKGSAADTSLLTDLTPHDIEVVGKWIRANIEHSDTECPHNSYSLKHLLEADTGIYLTNNQYKDAMLLAGFKPITENEINWRFRCSYIPDKIRNLNPFAIWARSANDITAPERDFISDMENDKDFPIFAEHQIILDYLGIEGACDGAIEAFEALWDKYLQEIRQKKDRR